MNTLSTACLEMAACLPSAAASAPSPGTAVRLNIPLITALVLSFSATVAFVGLSFTLLASRAETFRNLRVGFNTLRSTLPPRFWTLHQMPDDESFRGLVKYWQYAFDEWFITRKLNPLVFGRLWRVYYRDVLKVSCKSPVMLVALFQAAEGATATVDDEFVRLVLGQSFTDPAVLASAKAMAYRAGVPLPPGF